MSMAVRERHIEIGVLKTLGFLRGLVLRLILAEGALLGFCGAAIGLLLSHFLIHALPYIPVIGGVARSFSRMSVPPVIAATGVLIGTLVGLLSGVFPAVSAYRAQISELLMRT